MKKNFFFSKRYDYKIDLDLQTLQNVDDLDLTLNIIAPNRLNVRDQNNPNLNLSKNFLKWDLVTGEINSLEFSFWNLNKLVFGFLLILLIISISYFVRFYRYQIGSNFPELPSS